MEEGVIRIITVLVTVSRLPLFSFFSCLTPHCFSSSLTVTPSLLHSVRELRGRPLTTSNRNNSLLTSLISDNFMMNSVCQNIKLSHQTRLVLNKLTWCQCFSLTQFRSLVCLWSSDLNHLAENKHGSSKTI